MSRSTRKYNKEFKINAVNLYQESGKQIEEVAQNLGIPKSTLYTWIQEYRVHGSEGFRGSGVIKSCNEEVVKLKKQLAAPTRFNKIQ